MCVQGERCREREMRAENKGKKEKKKNGVRLCSREVWQLWFLEKPGLVIHHRPDSC